MRFRRGVMFFAAVVLAAMLASSAVAQSLQTPEQYLGFRVGSDKKLATWPQVVEYMKMAARASERIEYTELAPSTMGHPFPLMIVSSPANIARLDQIRADQKRLAYPYELSEADAAAIAKRNPAVILITLTIHSTEIGSTQMSLELIHRLATEQSDFLQHILDNVVFLLCPSVNPDGQVLVIDWYNKNVNTEHENSPMPWLYHKYTGHDNNRDAYMLTQVETQNVTRILYKDWFPLVFLDEHQMGSGGARIFVPPFVDPVNPNIDPAVLAASNVMGMHMFNALNQAGLTGVSYGERFTWWWQGSAKNGAWYHNMVGLLTEVASTRMATPIEQARARLYQVLPRRGEQGGGGGGQAQDQPVLAAPRDTWPRTNYPRPWLGGTWRLRDIIDYELVITYALLEASAQQKHSLQMNFYRLNRKAIDAGRSGNPFAYILPPSQHDPGAVYKLLEVLDRAGIEIYRATRDFTAAGREYPAGSIILPMGQPFRNYVKDLMEPQEYPMRPTEPGEAPERPYDVTGWTLPLQMGVNLVLVNRPFEAAMEKITPQPPAGQLVASRVADAPRSRRTGGTTYLLPHGWNSSAKAVNRLLKNSDVEVQWAAEDFRAGTMSYPAGTIVVRGRTRDIAPLMKQVAEETSVQVIVAEMDSAVPAWKLRAPRTALYQPWLSNMDEGWTRWLLEQYEFPYTSLHNQEIRRGGLRDKYDVIIFASQSRNSIMNGNRGSSVRAEYRGGVGAEGVAALKEFVRAGGTLVTLDNAADFAIDELGLPVRNVLRGVPSAEFFCPGAVLSILVDNRHPLGFGMPAETSGYFRSSPAFELSAGFTASSPRAVVRYPATNALQSGWIGGPQHLYNAVGAADVSYGDGRVVLLGFPVQFRAQPHATFKLLFNAIHWSAATR